MSTITTLPTAISPDSKGIIDTNFSNLNTDKAETSALTSGLATKQDTLVSGTNIKTINSTSILGSGDIVISGTGNVATDAIWDAKGDLAGGTGANTASRLAVGTNGQVLTADSAEATGLKWSNPAGGGDALTSGTLAQFASTTSLELKGVISDETGSGSLVFATSPTLVTPALGTPASGTLTNCIDLPLAGLVDINTNRILGRSTAGTGAVEELNVTAIPALIGLGTSDSPQFTGVNIGHATDTTMTRVSAGVAAIEGNNIITSNITGSTTQAGIAEASIASEVNTGTDANRYVSPDSLAGSNFGIRYVACSLNGTTALTTSDKAYFRIPSAITGMNLVSVSATVGTGASGSSSSGVPTFTVKNVTDSNQMLSTSLTVDASEYTSATAATPAVINASFDDVITDDLIEVACTVAGTGVTYATITLGFQLP